MTEREEGPGGHEGRGASSPDVEAPVSTASRRNPWRRAARVLVQTALTVGVTWIIVSRVGVTLEEALSPGIDPDAVAPAWLLFSVGLLFACFVAAARLWGRMVVELGGPDPGAGASVRIVLTANLGRYLPGKVWQIAGLALLSRRAGVPASLGTAAAVLTQLFHLAGAAVVGSVVVARIGGEASPGALLALVSLAALVLLASFPGLLRWALELGFRVARVGEVVVPPLGRGFGPRWILLHSAVWAAYGLAFVAFARGLGVGAAPVGLAASFAAAYLLGYLAVFAPAGIGVREGALIALLRPSVGASAVGIAVLARVWMTAAELVPAGALALWEIFRRDANGGAGGDPTRRERGGEGAR